MPIVRRDEATDPIGPLVLYLWAKKWIILGSGLVVGILTFVIMFLVQEEFKVTAQVYVNRHSLERRPTTREPVEIPNPLTVANLMKSPDIIAAVREDFRQAFDVDKLPRLERFAKGFTADTEVLQDTTVRKDVMPVIELSVRTKGSSETLFLMNSWLKHIIANLGDYATRETSQKRDALQREIELVEAELREADQNEARLRTETIYEQKLLTELMDILAPANPASPTAMMHERVPLNAEGSDNINLTVNTQTQTRTGLLQRLTDLQLQVAQAGGGNMTTPTDSLQSDVVAMQMVIWDVQTSITGLQTSAAALEQQLAAANREVTLKSRMLAELHGSLDRYAVLSAMQRHGTSELVGSDLQVLTRPVIPEQKVWPKRMTASTLAGIAAMLLTVLGLLIFRYLSGLASGPAGREVV